MVTLMKTEPLTLARLTGMAIAVTGATAAAAYRRIFALFTTCAGAAVTAVASSEGGSARGAQLILGLCVLVLQVFAAAALMIVCKRVTP